MYWYFQDFADIVRYQYLRGVYQFDDREGTDKSDTILNFTPDHRLNLRNMVIPGKDTRWRGQFYRFADDPVFF